MKAGDSVGPYRIVEKLGEGGMGEVYRARDTKLGRDVALKVLPGSLASDPERLARLRREAQTLAALNHPHIAQIYGFDDSGALHALVMELVEGPTLADSIARGSIPIDEAVPIARQITAALEAAHEHGIVHRDLKPANVKVRPDGTVKVLDFGLAKALDPAIGSTGSATESPTITSPAVTRMGVILGTAAYMSPEQAKGRQADKRSDVWAFGAVLYEMLSGRRAFQGQGIADTLAAVLRQDIDWAALPATTPSSMRRLLARCLERDVKRRLRDIGEARIALEDPAALAAQDGAAHTAPKAVWQRAMLGALIALVAAALTGTAVWLLMRQKPAAPVAVTRSTIVLPEGQQFPIAVSMRRLMAISPDGARVVYAGPNGLYLRSMSDLNAAPIAGTDSYQAVSDPVFSPDGRSIAFFASGDKTLKTIEVKGGAAVTICKVDDTFGISWQRDIILYGQGRTGIQRVSPEGRTPETIVRVKDGEEAHGPQLLPDGEHLLFTVATGTRPGRWDTARIVVQSLKSGEQTTIIEGGSDARYVPTGHIVYALSGSLYAVRFDTTRLQVTSRPALVVEGVRRPPGGATGTAQYNFSTTGSLVYIPGPLITPVARLEAALIDRQGRIETLKLPPGPYMEPRASPDGKRIAFFTDDGKEAIVWTYELSGATVKVRLTYGGNNRFPMWSADSTRIAFQSDREGDLAIFWQPADGTGKAERLTTPDKGTTHFPESWSPKTDTFLYSVRSGSDLSLWTFSPRERKATPFGGVRSLNASGATFSPDGRWVAYSTTTEGGSTTISVQPFPPTGAQYELFGKDGDVPHMAAWSSDGKELFFDPRAGAFEAASVTTQPTFAFGNPVAVPHPFQLGPVGARRAYDVAPDGRFVGLIPAGQKEFLTPIPPQIHVVLNWFQELKEY